MISKFTKTIGSTTLALGMTLGATASADAASEYIFYIGGTPSADSAENDVQWSTSTPLPSEGTGQSSFTGTISFTGGGLYDVQSSDGVFLTPETFTSWNDDGTNGFQSNSSISFLNGAVTGGSFEILDGEGETYAAQIASGGTLNKSAGDYFSLSNLTFNGGFSANVFGGADVSEMSGDGTFALIEFRPDAELSDIGSTRGFGRAEVTTDVGVSVVVPTPAAALAGLPMLGMLGLGYAVRRRRLNA